MTKHSAPFLIMIGVLVIGTLVCVFVFRGRKTIKLPKSINTVAAGYPFASEIKKSMDSGGYLSGAVVDLDTAGNDFRVRAITYSFESQGTNRTLLVQVDNTTGKAFALTVAESPRNPLIPDFVLQELDLSNISKDIPEVLEIAKTAKLVEFCKIAPPKTRNVSLHIGNGGSGAVWRLVADAWDEKGPIADLNIEVNPFSGAVIKSAFDKGVGR